MIHSPGEHGVDALAPLVLVEALQDGANVSRQRGRAPRHRRADEARQDRLLELEAARAGGQVPRAEQNRAVGVQDGAAGGGDLKLIKGQGKKEG
jgi:hypothetical protein